MEWLTGENVSIILFFIGVLGLVVRRNMIISIVAVGIMEMGVIVFFITMFAELNQEAPMAAVEAASSVDPVPHALMITAIVIGVAVTAISLTMVIHLNHKYQTLDWREASRKRALEYK